MHIYGVSIGHPDASRPSRSGLNTHLQDVVHFYQVRLPHGYRVLITLGRAPQVCFLNYAIASSFLTYPENTYPEILNVFHSGAVPTVAIGLTRLVSILAPFYGIIFVLPNALQDASATWWMPAAVTAITFVPLLASLVFGGYVNAINIRLPALARRSKEHLMSFSARVPPETLVEIKSMWFRPWPQTRTLHFGDLKRLPYSSVRLSNLEHTPYHAEEVHRKQPWVSWGARVLYGRYWVSRAQVKDRSRAPGAWDRMWEQIPIVGTVGTTGRVQNAASKPSSPPGRRVPPRTTKG